MTAPSYPVVRRVRVENHSLRKAEIFSHPPLAADGSISRGREADRDRFYTEFTPLVRRLICRYGKDQDMREDLTGEIYYRFCALLEAFDPMRGVPLRPYIVHQLTLATYTYARQQWRIQKRETSWEFEETHMDQMTFDPTEDWLATLAQDQVAALLPTALANLPARQRAVVICRYFEERSFEEIAELLGIQPNSARSLLRHGLNHLRKAIHPRVQF